MLILAIVLLVLAVVLFLLDLFAVGMTTAPSQQPAGLGGFCIGLLVASTICFGLWLGGYHLSPIFTKVIAQTSGCAGNCQGTRPPWCDGIVCR